MTAEEILLKNYTDNRNKFVKPEREYKKIESPLSEQVVLKAMKEYAKQEYERGIEDGKTIAKHGTTMWQE